MSETSAGGANTRKEQVGADVDTYDRGIVPAETAARREREGAAFKETPSESQGRAGTDDQTDDGSLRTTGGYTTDKEGLANNYAIEPEMYVNEPGDLRQEEDELAAERGQQLRDVNQDEEGKLTVEEDARGKGPGII
jgi:hypothetical protein